MLTPRPVATRGHTGWESNSCPEEVLYQSLGLGLSSSTSLGQQWCFPLVTDTAAPGLKATLEGGVPISWAENQNIFPSPFPPHLICFCFFLEPSNIQHSHLSTLLRWLPDYLESIYSLALQQGRVDLVPSRTLRYGHGDWDFSAESRKIKAIPPVQRVYTNPNPRRHPNLKSGTIGIWNWVNLFRSYSLYYRIFTSIPGMASTRCQ